MTATLVSRSLPLPCRVDLDCAHLGLHADLVDQRVDLCETLPTTERQKLDVECDNVGIGVPCATDGRVRISE
eukprot:17738-Eustigmatos_ZCMA.PRE.1